ncbi:MAG TPA: hypothetical protein VJL89_11625 [Thermodesulfovibrionia bacterium]|nr:hypothetical protein [Thermodesulfovibrionia bacterium]
MVLKFKDNGSGFYLQSRTFQKEDWDFYDDSLSCEIGEDVLVNERKEIVYYSLTFINGYQDIDIEIKEAARRYSEPIFYDIPALDIYHATFTEALRCIKNFYASREQKQELAVVY